MFKDRVYETSTSTGTGTFTLAGAVTGYRAFSAAFGTAAAYYTIVNRNAPTEWEIGQFTVSGTTLTRVAGSVLSSSSGAGTLVNFSAGTKEVFNAIPAVAATGMDPATILTTVRTRVDQDLRINNCMGLIPNGNCNSNPVWDMPDANWWSWGTPAITRNTGSWDNPNPTKIVNTPLTQINVKNYGAYTLYQSQVAYDIYRRNAQNCNCGPANCYTNCNCNCNCATNCGGRC